MFDSVLQSDSGSARRFWPAAAISVLIHLLGLGLIAWASAKTPAHRDEGQAAITFMSGPRAAAPPIGSPLKSPAGKAFAHLEPRITKRRPPSNKLTASGPSKRVESTLAPDPTRSVDQPEAGVGGGIAGGVAGGVPGGAPGGVVGGSLAGSLRTEVLPFGEGMTRPMRIDGQDPVYTREALEARVEGLTIVKCVITAEGKAEHCRMIKALPHMGKAVLDALATQKFKPVTFQGRPVSVEYVFNIRLALPRN